MREIWFSEYHSSNLKLSVRIKEELFTTTSEYQSIDIFDSYEYGRILALDGCIILTERDQFIYHEMITHVPMAIHPNVKNVLLIGSGNGGTLGELLRYSSIQSIDLVEIDKTLLEAVKHFFPNTAKSFGDSRVKIHNMDALQFVRHVHKQYDLIIVDATDPYGTSEGLFSKEFYGNCYEALRDDGILINQHESAFSYQYLTEADKPFSNTKGLFPINKLYQVHIPTFPAGQWLFGFVSKKYDPTEDLDEYLLATKMDGIETNYYSADVHRAAFVMPRYTKELFSL